MKVQGTLGFVCHIDGVLGLCVLRSSAPQARAERSAVRGSSAWEPLFRADRPEG